MTSNAVEKFHKESFSNDSTNKNTNDGSHWSCFGKFFGGRKAIYKHTGYRKVLIKGHDPCARSILTSLTELENKGTFPALSWLIFWLNISEAP